MKRIDLHKIAGTPYIAGDVDLKWYRGASRYNNGATLYGRKYSFQLVISRPGSKEVQRSNAGTGDKS